MQLEQSHPTPFFKGISLSDYMRDMDCPEEEDTMNQTNDQNNDLFLHCQPKTDLAHYSIKEIDQDNYDQSTDHQDLIIQPMHNYDLQRARIIPQDVKNKVGGHVLKIIDVRRTKHHSKSPLKDNPPAKKDMFRSLYGQNFTHEAKQQPGQLLSTLGISNWRGKHSSLNKKEVQTRDKHRRQYQQLVRYESVVNQRLDTKLNSIRIDGVKDKIHERSEKFSKNR